MTAIWALLSMGFAVGATIAVRNAIREQTQAIVHLSKRLEYFLAQIGNLEDEIDQIRAWNEEGDSHLH